MFSRPRLFLAVGIVGAVLAGGLWLLRAPDAPLPPDLETVNPSSEFANAEASIAYYRDYLRRHPDAVEQRVRLAQVLLQHARATGRAGDYIPEAHRLLDEALEREPDHYHGRTLLAALYNTLHQFEEARDLSEELLAEFPEHTYTHGTLIDALVELGEYERAIDVSDRMLAIRPGLPSYSRASYLRELHGDTDGAIAAMRMAADAELAGREARAWALLQLGNLYLGQAKADTAAYLFNGILEERPDFAPAVGALAHVALVKGDIDGAIARLEEARSLQPRETFDELLVEAYALRGDDARAEQAADRVLDALHAARAMGENVDMEEADYLADLDRDLDRVLTLAKAQVERRPGHLHANETYAWALYKHGRPQDGIPYIERALRLGTGDAMVHFRAARIYDAAGRPGEAAEHYRAALDGNLRIESPTAAQDAHSFLAALNGSTPVQATSAVR